LEGDLAIGKYIENVVLRLLKGSTSSQNLYDLYLFIDGTKETSESISDIFLELIAWAFISQKDKQPFLYFCRSNLLIHNRLLDIFAKKIIGLDFKSCNQRINELCDDLNLDKSYIYVQYFKSIKKSQPAKISIFLDNLTAPMKYEILRATLESQDEELILKLDSYISFSPEFKEYIIEYIYDGSELVEKYLHLCDNMMFKMACFRDIVLRKNERQKDLKDSIYKIITKCKDSRNFSFLYEIASNGEVRLVFKAICETKNQERIAQFMEKFKSDEYIRSLSVYI
jgi:hypothetical protein